MFFNGQGTKENGGVVGNCRDSRLLTKRLDINSNQRVDNDQELEETQINPYLQVSLGIGARPPYSR